LEADVVPEKVTISHRGARYEIGRGKRYYGIWVTGAPESDPVDRWPETQDGWAQAWTRFVSLEVPGTIAPVEQRGFKLPGVRFARLEGGGSGKTAMAAAVLLGVGIILGIAGLFPNYFAGQSLAAQADQLVPHLLYFAGWAVSAALIADGARRGQATGAGARIRAGALLGTGLSAVTLGMFLSDLGQAVSGTPAPGAGAGLVLGILGWAVCAAGSVAGLAARGQQAAAAPDAAATAGTSPAGTVPGEAVLTGTIPGGAVPTGTDPATGTVSAEAASADTVSPDTVSAWAVPAGAVPAGTAGTPAGATAAWNASNATARVGGPDGLGRPVRPRKEHAGPIALLVLGAIGTVAAFAPSWDSYTLQSPAGTQTITAGNAFASPGTVITGDVLVMIAVVAVALAAALWRPMRQGAVLLAGAIIPLVGQAISALIQVSQPVSPAQFGLSQGQASAVGLTISSGVTPIFWVYCVFVIALVISCAWLFTEPALPVAPTPVSTPWASPVPPGGNENPESTARDSDGGPEGGKPEGNAENSYA
jgi:hypothetical protein